MNPLWDYFWPIFAAGVVAGALAGHFAYRRLRIGRRDRLAGESELIRQWRRTRRIVLASGAVAALAVAAPWHGPLGAGDQLAARIETIARAGLIHFEMSAVSARVERDPLLRRQLVLSGPADEFQHRELVRMMDEIPGVAGVRWATPVQPSEEGK